MQFPRSLVPARRRPPADKAVLAAAEVFIRQYAAENPGAGDPRR
ncbi:hypothetical protein [Streptomyces sp. NPDC007856]